MNRIAARRPGSDEWTSGYHGEIIAATQGEDVLRVLDDQLFWLCELAGWVSPMVVDTVHRPHRWTIRQVFAHGVDCERVLGFRLQHIAAGDSTPLPAFDHDAYAADKFGLGNFSNLVTEWGYARMSNLLLLRRVAPRCWDRRGNIGGDSLTLRSMAWFLAGHLRHHLEIVETRIGQTVAHAPPTSPADSPNSADSPKSASTDMPT